MRRSTALGIHSTPAHVDFGAVMDSVQKVIGAIAPNDSMEWFERLGVRVLRAEARFTDPRTVRAGNIEIRPRRFVIATGSYPAVPAIRGLDRVPYLTNEPVFANRERSEHLVVIGEGADRHLNGAGASPPRRADHRSRHRSAVAARRSGPRRLPRAMADKKAWSPVLGSRSPISHARAKRSSSASPTRRWRADYGVTFAHHRRPPAEHRGARPPGRRDPGERKGNRCRCADAHDQPARLYRRRRHGWPAIHPRRQLPRRDCDSERPVPAASEDRLPRVAVGHLY
jgi:hypothetical protein